MQDGYACSRYLFSSRFQLSILAIGLSFALVSLLASQISAQRPGKAGGPIKAGRARVVLETFPVARSSRFRYEMSLATCAKSGCPFQVRLIEGKQVCGTESLEWLATPAQIDKTEVDVTMGVGDPFQSSWEGSAWQVGEENQNVTVTARSIALTPDLNGVMVYQSAGFEHVKRRHYLFVAIERKLTLAWSNGEGSGPTWSSVEVSEPLPDGSQTFIYFKGFWYPRESGPDDKPDTLEVASFRWNAQKAVIENAPMQESSFSLFALIAGVYDTLADAEKAKQLHFDCLRGFMVLSDDSPLQIPKGKFAVAALTTKTSLAEPVVAGCAPALRIKAEQLSQ
jgi:hypothetical protein